MADGVGRGAAGGGQDDVIVVPESAVKRKKMLRTFTLPMDAFFLEAVRQPSAAGFFQPNHTPCR